MNIYRITVGFQGYDTYDSFVIICGTEKRAKEMAETEGNEGDKWIYRSEVEKIGETEAEEERIVLGSFNVGINKLQGLK